jgi:predicted Zn-dependent protease
VAAPEPPPTPAEASIEREIEVTAGVHEQIRAQAPLINDPIVLDYIYELGSELVAQTEPQPFTFRFFIIDDENLNAFTIGGGYVYLHSAVVAQAGDVNELAGVLAHEIAHVRERHVAKRAEGSGLATLATLAGLAAVIAGADPGVLLVAQGLNQSLQIQHTRRAEGEADREGLAYMVKARYDPTGMSRFFQRILAAYPDRDVHVPAYLYTHPAVEERVAGARIELERIGAPTITRSDPRLAEIQERLTLLRSRVAGGTGLYARAEFDRAKTDPLLAEAERARAAGDLSGADAVLARAEAAEPHDPRVALARADLAEARADLPAARDQLERAWRLDPQVPLVQYRLGVVHRKLGNRSRAVFMLERAAAAYRPGTRQRLRAEVEIQRTEFPVFSESGLDRPTPEGVPPRYLQGEIVTWSGRLGRRYQGQHAELVIDWFAPDGSRAFQEIARHSPTGALGSRLFTRRDAPTGLWSVRVQLADTLVEERSFELAPRP